MKYLLIITFSFMYQFSYADIKSCVEIEEDAKRLSCYDSFFINKDNIDIANEDIIEEEKVAEVSIQEYEQENFGLPSKLRQAEDAEELKIVSRIDSVSQRLNLQLIIILENGQIWQSVEKIRDIRLRDGYDVEIKEGFLSGYTLRVPGKKIKLRVRRQK